MIHTLMEKVDNIKEQMGNRDGNSKRGSIDNSENQKQQTRN